MEEKTYEALYSKVKSIEEKSSHLMDLLLCLTAVDTDDEKITPAMSGCIKIAATYAEQLFCDLADL